MEWWHMPRGYSVTLTDSAINPEPRKTKMARAKSNRRLGPKGRAALERAREVRSLYANTNLTQAEIGKRFDLSASQVCLIINQQRCRSSE
jgi:hypothetical protein